MLEIRPSCEHCDKDLPYDSTEAYICTFECTYCQDCVENVLSHVCHNCGGNFQQRAIRPKELDEKYPLSRKRIHKPVHLEKHKERIEALRKTTLQGWGKFFGRTSRISIFVSPSLKGAKIKRDEGNDNYRKLHPLRSGQVCR